MVKPDWFDLGDYPGNYSPEYWAFQILYRLELLEGLEYCKVDPELAKQTFLFARDQWLRPISTPIKLEPAVRPLLVEDMLRLDSRSQKNEGFREISERISSLRKALDKTILDQGSLIDRVLAAGSSEERGEIEFVGSEAMEIIGELVSLDSTPFSSIDDHQTSELYCVIDIEQDNEALVADFLKVVESRRSEIAVKTQQNSLNSPDLARWHTAGVLPYFDLSLWFSINGLKVTNSQIGKLIWPNANFNEAERVRKTTKKHVEEAISLKTYNRLLSKIQNSSTG